ncbi:hypothetical protein CEXT_541081 [Caerostris extrusa]|uniref:Uncharacterized protein n=1 Tax=Caerostris extrusa TaxID=172846 RepID=A0AAV4YGK2_CAEEX|nr:hypothetical protein CEXT_541081 [Caerostris extrusa]
MSRVEVLNIRRSANLQCWSRQLDSCWYSSVLLVNRFFCKIIPVFFPEIPGVFNLFDVFDLEVQDCIYTPVIIDGIFDDSPLCLGCTQSPYHFFETVRTLTGLHKLRGGLIGVTISTYKTINNNDMRSSGKANFIAQKMACRQTGPANVVEKPF